MYTSSLILLVMGMGTTFVFLYILILCTNLSSKFVPKLAKFIPDPEPKKPAKPATAAKPADDDAAIAAAIAVALLKAKA